MKLKSLTFALPLFCAAGAFAQEGGFTAESEAQLTPPAPAPAAKLLRVRPGEITGNITLSEAFETGSGDTFTFSPSNGGEPPLVLSLTQGSATYLGLSTSSPSPELAAQISLPPDTGLVVQAVGPGSPAEKAGIQKNDVLSKLDDQILIDTRQLTVLVRNHKEGDRVKFSLIRHSKPMEITVELGKRHGGEKGASEALPAFSIPEMSGDQALRGRRIIRRVQLDPAPGEIQELKGGSVPLRPVESGNPGKPAGDESTRQEIRKILLEELSKIREEGKSR